MLSTLGTPKKKRNWLGNSSFHLQGPALVGLHCPVGWGQLGTKIAVYLLMVWRLSGSSGGLDNKNVGALFLPYILPIWQISAGNSEKIVNYIRWMIAMFGALKASVCVVVKAENGLRACFFLPRVRLISFIYLILYSLALALSSSLWCSSCCGWAFCILTYSAELLVRVSTTRRLWGTICTNRVEIG